MIQEGYILCIVFIIILSSVIMHQKNEYTEKFSEEINKYRPDIKYTLPYTKPIYGIIEIDPKGILTIKGKQSSYILPDPKELEIKRNYQATPSISDRSLKF